ncbi:hypothetical protein B7463_g4376, partial [Scytalidium lignicola]
MKQTMMQRRSQAIYDQHKRLGDVVRVGPRHVSLNDPVAIKDIYGHQAIGRMQKDEFYEMIKGQAYEITQVPGVEEHSRRRRYLAHAFSLRTVVSMEPVIHDNAMNLINALDKFCEKSNDLSSVNVRMWFNYFTLDVIGDMAMGLKFGFLKNGSDASVAQRNSGLVYNVKSTINIL